MANNETKEITVDIQGMTCALVLLVLKSDKQNGWRRTSEYQFSIGNRDKLFMIPQN